DSTIEGIERGVQQLARKLEDVVRVSAESESAKVGHSLDKVIQSRIKTIVAIEEEQKDKTEEVLKYIHKIQGDCQATADLLGSKRDQPVVSARSAKTHGQTILKNVEGALESISEISTVFADYNAERENERIIMKQHIKQIEEVFEDEHKSLAETISTLEKELKQRKSGEVDLSQIRAETDQIKKIAKESRAIVDTELSSLDAELHDMEDLLTKALKLIPEK
ncbi:hypothetical protein ADUPG1_010510, partial [Aduncisulcus paluster]